MSKRTRRPRSERAARHERREAKRESRREKRAEAERRVERYAQASYAYDTACLGGWACELGQFELIACERCGLVQVNAGGVIDEDTGVPLVTTCPGPLDLGCGSEHAVTLESFAE